MIEQSIRALAVGIAPGENRGGLECPFCNGGTNHDKAFSVAVSDDGTILFKCHRVSCGAKGRVGGGVPPVRGLGSPVQQPKREPAHAPEPRQPRTYVEEATLYDQYGLEVDTLDRCQVEHYEDASLGPRLTIPIEAPAGVDLRGYLRGYDYRELPPCTRRDKSRHYRLYDGVWAGCFGTAEEGLVVVEDAWSAMKVMQELPGYMGYCLMGTHMTVEHVLEINRLSKNWFLCLDRDATLKAINYKQKFRHLGDFKVCPLTRDMKYMDSTEMEGVLNQ